MVDVFGERFGVLSVRDFIVVMNIVECWGLWHLTASGVVLERQLLASVLECGFSALCIEAQRR